MPMHQDNADVERREVCRSAGPPAASPGRRRAAMRPGATGLHRHPMRQSSRPAEPVSRPRGGIDRPRPHPVAPQPLTPSPRPPAPPEGLVPVAPPAATGRRRASPAGAPRRGTRSNGWAAGTALRQSPAVRPRVRVDRWPDHAQACHRTAGSSPRDAATLARPDAPRHSCLHGRGGGRIRQLPQRAQR